VAETVEEQRRQGEEGNKQRPTAWVHLALGVLGALLLLWYRDVLQFWRVEWTGNAGYYSHGPLVPVLAAILIWMRREQLSRAPSAPSYLGLVAVAAGGALKLGSTWVSTTGVEAFASFSFPIVLWGLILGLYGGAIARILAGPVAFLWLMCPLPGALITELSFPLQLASTRLGVGTASILGVNVHQEGTAIHLETLSLFVGEACSGFRSTLGLMMLSAFAAVSSRLGAGKKLLLLLSALPIGLAANGFRIAAITWAAERWGREAAIRAHDTSGLVVLALACVAVAATARILGWLDDTDTW